MCCRLNAQAALLLCTLLLALFARCKGYTLAEIEEMAAGGIRSVAGALLINICIGMLIAAWVSAGTVSFFLRLCLRLLEPRFFLLEAFAFCCVFSALLGSCWICAGTVGLILFFTAQPLCIDPCLLLGAIVGGSRFGACVSPISESANISRLFAGVEDIYDHARGMAGIALPAALVTAGLYFALDLALGPGRGQALELARLDAALAQAFRPSLLALLPALTLALLIYRKKSALTCLLASIAAGGLVACLLQGLSFREVADILLNGYGAYLPPGGDNMLARLFARGGMASMSNVLLTLLIGVSMSGILNRLGILQTIVGAFAKRLKAPWQAVLFSMLFSILGYGATGDSQPAKVLVSGAFRGPYAEAGLPKPVLSRTLEMAAFGEGMFPWTVGAVYLASLFGVEVTRYWYFIFFYWFAMLFNVWGAARQTKGSRRA